MPSNLFVVVFPRKVQAHTVWVTRREKPKSKWSVGGLRSPPGVFLAREGRMSTKGDDKSGVGDSKAGTSNNLLSTSTSGSASGSTRDERLMASEANRNELKNQKTVRVQLSRPTEELVPDTTETSRKGSTSGHHKSESITQSWHPTHAKLLAADSIHSSTGGGGGSLGSSAPGVAASWAGGEAGRDSKEQHQQHQQQPRKRGSFSHAPSPSIDLGSNAGLGGEGGGLADIFGAKIGSRGRSSSSTFHGGYDTNAGRGSGDGGGPESGVPNNTSLASPPPGSSGGAATPPGTGDDGAAGNDGEAVGNAMGDHAVAKDDVVVHRPVGNRVVPQGGVAQAAEHMSLPTKSSARGAAANIPQEKRPSDTSTAIREGTEHALQEDSTVEEKAGGDQARPGFLAADDESKDPEKLAGEGLHTPDGANSTPGSDRRLVTEVIGDDNVDVSKPQDRDEGEKVDIEGMVRGVLLEMRTEMLLIGEPTFHVSAAGKLMTCIFPCDVEDAHLVLTRLESVGVGSECGSVNVLPMEIGHSDITRRRQREGVDGDEERSKRQRHTRATGGRFGDGSSGPSAESDKDEDAVRRANERFRALASQIRVTQVTEEIREGTKFHFDYMALLVASSAISAMGLATDNVAVVVAAMLVSPIMGPVLAFTFGTNVRDWSLAKKGFLVESFSLLICVGVGFLVGMVGVLCVNEDTWPTHEMETRGNPWGLLTGCAIAIPSGMAVALSILSKNVNSLVGVAISASLLPPAVNTGLCLSVALLGPVVVEFHIDAMQYVQIGLISMGLTIVNISSIYVAGVWLFIFKEVAPIKSENSFWSQDMIHARKFQQKLGKSGGEGGEAANNLRRTLLEAANRHREDPKPSSPNHRPDTERKGSFSSETATHHRYRRKDRRRRPTVFDLFPDMGDNTSPEPEPMSSNAQRESGAVESRRLKGLMAMLKGNSDNNTASSTNNNNTSGNGSDEPWKHFQNLLGGGGGHNSMRGGGSG